MRLEVAWILGWVGAVLAVGFNLPQAYRSCVRGLTAGLPPARLWLSLQNSTLWLLYGLAGAGAVQVFGNLVNSLIGISLLVVVYRVTPLARRKAPVWGALLVTVVSSGAVLAHFAGPAAVGAVAACATILPGLPQLVALLRDPDVSGLSPVSTVLGLACNAAWFGHGVLAGEAAVWVPCLWQLGMGTTVLVLLTRARHAALNSAAAVLPASVPVGAGRVVAPDAAAAVSARAERHGLGARLVRPAGGALARRFTARRMSSRDLAYGGPAGQSVAPGVAGRRAGSLATASAHLFVR
jgi:uncharacterized protein with PQ loop repeat